jgi:hypothetical protein
MAAKPAYKRLIGRTIVGFEQRWFPKEQCREGAWGVQAIVLDDGARIVLHVGEHETEYSVRLVRCPQEDK